MRELIQAVKELLRAQEQMRKDWAESDQAHQRDLWYNLHNAAQEVREIMESKGDLP